MERDRRPHYELKLIGFPSWEIELVDDIVKATENNWAHNKVIISFKATFSRPPQDPPKRVAYINRTFSAPLDALMDEFIGFDLIERMFELIFLPFFGHGYDQVIAGVKRIADTHRADLSATTPIGLLMNINISTFLHEIPSVYFDYEGGDLGLVTDIRDLLGYDVERPYMDVHRVIPHYLPYDESEKIFQRTRLLDDSGKSLERVTVDVDSSISTECNV